MGLLDMLMGNDETDTAMSDRDIASDMLKDSKFAVSTLAMAVTEVVNPEIRDQFHSALMTAIRQHYQLSDIVMSKEWYQPHLPPREQVSQDMKMSQHGSQDQGARERILDDMEFKTL